MKGYQITFFTQQDRRHHGKPLADWLLQLARDMGLHGATVIPGAEGFGRDGRVHSTHFFELAEQPLEVLLVVAEAEAEALFARLRAEDLRVFYVKTPVEFGMSGEE
jgi:PII-like signaling protein